jgi:hypothetical protein
VGFRVLNPAAHKDSAFFLTGSPRRTAGLSFTVDRGRLILRRETRRRPGFRAGGHVSPDNDAHTIFAVFSFSP